MQKYTYNQDCLREKLRLLAALDEARAAAADCHRELATCHGQLQGCLALLQECEAAGSAPDTWHQVMFWGLMIWTGLTGLVGMVRAIQAFRQPNQIFLVER